MNYLRLLAQVAIIERRLIAALVGFGIVIIIAAMMVASVMEGPLV